MKSLITSLLVLTISACAYSPQQVNLAPEFSSDNVFAQGENIVVDVRDSRDDKTIGNRSTDPEHDSAITPNNNYLNDIKAATEGALLERGFTSDSTADKDADLLITITQLSYNNIADQGHAHQIQRGT